MFSSGSLLTFNMTVNLDSVVTKTSKFNFSFIYSQCFGRRKNRNSNKNMKLLHIRHRWLSSQFNLLRHCAEQKRLPTGIPAVAVVVNNCYGQRQRYFASEAAAKAPAIKSNGRLAPNGPGLKEFLIAGRKPALVAQPTRTNANPIVPENTVPYLDELDYNGRGRTVFFEVYGCQMNVNDTEIVWSILKNNGYEKAGTAESADIVLLMTCAIREKAETKVNDSLRFHFVLTQNFTLFDSNQFTTK